MEFKFKRKYTFFFFLALSLHILVLTLWFALPDQIFRDSEIKKLIFLLVTINIELILVFYLGLFKKKYYAYYDRLLIKRSFFTNTLISYKDITRIKERNSDTILLGFGHRPSFVIYYRTKRLKKCIIRSDNTELLLKVIKNEIDISKLNNNDKKLTK